MIKKMVSSHGEETGEDRVSEVAWYQIDIDIRHFKFYMLAK